MEKSAPHLVDVPVELIHRIQSLLPAREAARTCVLSKSWLHAWSTIPNLRFKLYARNTNIILTSIEGTLLRYHKENIPIESFDLRFEFDPIRNEEDISIETFYLRLDDIIASNQMLASLVKKWIRLVMSHSSCLKELSLTFNKEIDSFTLADVMIFTGENLNMINVRAPLRICSNPAVTINCVSLRELRLHGVKISDDGLHNLLSTCSLLEKVTLLWCEGLKSIKVKNLLCLRELRLSLMHGVDLLEFHNVPSLLLFYYKSSEDTHLPFNADSLGSVTQLHISGVHVDNALLDIIKSKFPLLQSLNLVIYSWGPESLVITSGSIKMLTLQLWDWVRKSIDVLVYAPNLISFSYEGTIKPALLFPIVAPKQIKVISRQSLIL